MYKYSCYTENTKEAREWLEKSGYKMKFIISFVDFEIIFTWKGEYYFIDKKDLRNMELSLFINCLGNLPLFKALTAVRDDNDYIQWFTDGKVWILCMGKEFCKWYYSQSEYIDFSSNTIHKATDKELIEKFKKKEENGNASAM